MEVKSIVECMSARTRDRLGLMGKRAWVLICDGIAGRRAVGGRGGWRARKVGSEGRGGGAAAAKGGRGRFDTRFRRE
jgi:hypothetical protein